MVSSRDDLLLLGSGMKQNKLKQMLREGKRAVGCSVMFPSPEIVEMLAAIGFDWVLIDCEHGAISMAAVEDMARAAEAFDITAIARPRRNNAEEIMLLMDRGVMGVQVPYVDTRAHAEAAVSAVKFGSTTARGLAVGTRTHRYGFSGSQSEFTKKSNEETMVVVQIETIDAINNLEEILQVDDVDAYFIGPSDLSQSMGFPGNSAAPAVAKAIATGVSTILKAGKITGMPASIENASTISRNGIRLIHAHLPQILGNGGKEFIKKCDVVMGRGRG